MTTALVAAVIDSAVTAFSVAGWLLTGFSDRLGDVLLGDVFWGFRAADH
jgi:hypothetical protein